MKNSHLFRSFAIATALVALATSCSENEEIPAASQAQTQQTGEPVTLTAVCDMPETKVSYAEGEGRLEVFWKTDDAFRLYSGGAAPIGNFILAAADNGKKSGKFDGTAPAGTFNAFFPASAENTPWSALNASYENQQQDGAGTTAHLARYNYMMAKEIVIANNQPTARINFAHLGSVMQFDITLPEGYKPEVDGQPTEITLTAPGMTKSVKPSGGAGDATSSLTLKLTGITLTPIAKTFTAYMMCAPFTIPANGSLNITLLCKATNAEGNITRTFYEFDKSYTAGKVYEAGKRYQFTGLGTTNAFTPRKTITIAGVDFNFVMVRGGTFQMGSPDDSGENSDLNEKPRHWVKITKDYYIGETEVTQAQWKAIMKDSPSYHDGVPNPNNPGSATPVGEIQENRPVESISWNDICVNSSEDGHYSTCFLNAIKPVVPGTPTFNLPTEAQWEYAARGGHKWRLFDYMKWPGTDSEAEVIEYAWCGVNIHGTHEVKLKKPNLLGLYDMAGNVVEICLDMDFYEYIDHPNENNPEIDPCGKKQQFDLCSIRGGHHNDLYSECRSASRDYDYLASTYSNSGFRLILVP